MRASVSVKTLIDPNSLWIFTYWQEDTVREKRRRKRKKRGGKKEESTNAFGTRRIAPSSAHTTHVSFPEPSLRLLLLIGGRGRKETIQRQYAIRLLAHNTLMRTATLVEKWEGTEIRVPLKNVRKILWWKMRYFCVFARPSSSYWCRAPHVFLESWAMTNYLFQAPASQEASSKSSRSD